MIFWNSNFAEAPDGFVNETDLNHAFFAAGGRLLLGFSSIGNTVLLDELCARRRAARGAAAGPAVVANARLRPRRRHRVRLLELHLT